MTLTAKYKSQCIICARTIKPGSKIEYQKGKGSWHVACTGKTAAPLNSRMPDQMLAADVDLVALAAKHGRQLDGEAKLLSLMVSEGATVGQVRPNRGKRLLVLALSSYRYYSRDFLEDMDMFSMRPGRYADAQAVAVLPTAEEAATEAETKHSAARKKEIQASLRSSYNADSHIGVAAPEEINLEQIYGDSRLAGSETWYLGSDGIVYYCRSDYDMGPSWWRTTATSELLAEAKRLGVKA